MAFLRYFYSCLITIMPRNGYPVELDNVKLEVKRQIPKANNRLSIN